MLNVSIVLYQPEWEQVRKVCTEVAAATSVQNIYLIDNSLVSSEESAKEMMREITKEMVGGVAKRMAMVKYIWNEGKNLGYGRGHNIAIRESIWLKTKYHLVMNADVWVKATDIDRLHAFMEHNELVGSVMPKVVYPDGRLQYLCKLLPTPWDMFARRFLPMKWTKKRNERYELRMSGYDKIMNVPYLSGCFMLLRTAAVLQARLFDERYFMYPEDMDLTRTIHRDWLTLFVPDVTIVHDHAQASYHSWKMTWIHIVNMCRYFHKWGWFCDKERQTMNRLTLEQL